MKISKTIVTDNEDEWSEFDQKMQSDLNRPAQSNNPSDVRAFHFFSEGRKQTLQPGELNDAHTMSKMAERILQDMCTYDFEASETWIQEILNEATELGIVMKRDPIEGIEEGEIYEPNWS